MSRIARVLLLLFTLPIGALAPGQEKAGELPVGSTPEQARARLGAPIHVSRQLLAHRTVEQWTYGPPHNVRLVIDCPRGEVPRLVRIRATGRGE
jgi:hypothetical protein